MEKNEVKSITFTYAETQGLSKWLADAMLHGTELRSRNRIVDILIKQLQEFDKVRIEIVKKYAELDKKTKEPLMNEDGQTFKMKDTLGFQKEWLETLEAANFTFDILPSNLLDWGNVKTIILNLKKDFNYADGMIYSSICDKFEEKQETKKDK